MQAAVLSTPIFMGRRNIQAFWALLADLCCKFAAFAEAPNMRVVGVAAT
jgi:hypothetical protein